MNECNVLIRAVKQFTLFGHPAGAVGIMALIKFPSPCSSFNCCST